MAESWRIRPGREDDVHAVLQLEQEIEEAPHWTRREYAEMVVSAPGEGAVARRLFVATERDQVIGFSVGARAGEAAGELESVAVSASSRRMGVGRALCAAALSWCDEQGARCVDLEVRAASLGAVALYESLGFERVGVRRGYYANPSDDALLMRLRM